MICNRVFCPVCLNAVTTAGIVIGVLVLAGAILVFAVILAIRGHLRRLQSALPAALLGQLQQKLAAGVLNNQGQEPVSLPAMDRVFGPQIQADFPELNLAELKKRAERLAHSTLAAIDAQDTRLLSEPHELYLTQIRQSIEKLKSLEQREQYSDITVHRSVIADYRKDQGTCRIQFQLAIGARYRKIDQSGQMLAGRDEISQFSVGIEALYVQDKDHPGLLYPEALAVNCPNCGAPIASLGDRRCAFCGSAIEPINNKVWTFSRFERSADRQ